MPLPDFSRWTFDIDKILNHVVPPPPWHYLPYPITHFFGFRKGKINDLGNLVVIFWAFIGIFAGVALIEVVTEQVPSFKNHGAPIIVGSFGAAAVLEFYSIESPLAQPRNAIFGQLVACIVGVSIAKLFLLLPPDDFETHRWLAGALACASATAVMALTKTVHPPAGATALLAVVEDEILGLGWLLIPVVMLGCVLMLVVALTVNNIQRRFPLYWWSPEALDPIYLRYRRGNESDAARKSEEGTSDEFEHGLHGISTVTARNPEESKILIRAREVSVPEHLYLSSEERTLLEALSNRIRLLGQP